jgi:hypothetical protein
MAPRSSATLKEESGSSVHNRRSGKKRKPEIPNKTGKEEISKNTSFSNGVYAVMALVRRLC